MSYLSPMRKLKKNMTNSKSSKPQPDASLSDVVLGNEKGSLAILEAMKIAAKDQQKIIDKANSQ